MMNEADTMDREQDILRRLASDDSSEVRQAAFEAGDLGLQSAVAPLVEHFANSSVGVQEAAERALRKIRAGCVRRARVRHDDRRAGCDLRTDLRHERAAERREYLGGTAGVHHCGDDQAVERDDKEC